MAITKRDQVGPNLWRRTINVTAAQITGGLTSVQLPIDNLGDNPMSLFSLEVTTLDVNGNKVTDSGATWSALVLGSLDGVGTSQILSHVSGTNDNGAVVTNPNLPIPVSFAVLSVSNLDLSTAVSIQISALGVPNVNLKG